MTSHETGEDWEKLFNEYEPEHATGYFELELEGLDLKLEQQILAISSEDPFPTTSRIVSATDTENRLLTQTHSSRYNKTAALREEAAKLSCDFPGCETTFRRSGDLKRHVRYKHRPDCYRCEATGCLKVFFRKDHLREHERRLHYSEVHRLQRNSLDRASPIITSAEDAVPNTIELAFKPNGTFDNRGLEDRALENLSDIKTSTFSSEGLYATSDSISINNMSTRSRSSRGPISLKGITDTDLRSAVRFACPFRKHDRKKYNVNDYMTCAMSGWINVSRLKEHLFRCHKASPQCPRCWEHFKSQETLAAHIRSDFLCEKKPGNRAEGISIEVEQKLKSRQKCGDRSEETRWQEIYCILFPSSQHPSPYFEPIEEVVPAEEYRPPAFPGLITNENDNTMLSGLGSWTPWVSWSPQAPPVPTSHEIENRTSSDIGDCTSYLRAEFPRSFNNYLKTGLPSLDNGLRSELVSIAAECHNQLITEYSARTADKPEMGISLDGLEAGPGSQDIDETWSEWPVICMDTDVRPVDLECEWEAK